MATADLRSDLRLWAGFRRFWTALGLTLVFIGKFPARPVHRQDKRRRCSMSHGLTLPGFLIRA